MTWGTYYFFYECPQCGKKYRYELEGSADEEFGFCPECHVMGTFVGETPPAGGHKGRPYIFGVPFLMGCLVALVCRGGCPHPPAGHPAGQSPRVRLCAGRRGFFCAGRRWDEYGKLYGILPPAPVGAGG